MSLSSEPAREPKTDESEDEGSSRPQYEVPRITRMTEKDVLKSFQVTTAATSWWVM